MCAEDVAGQDPPCERVFGRATARGTPCARSWTDDWIARVAAREDELGRRICGARTVGHVPCPAPSDHPSGRCAHHGGFPLTGAPEGNRNAAVHMLYARRLMPCGSHCPNWNACPLGGGAADAGKELLSRKQAERPTCPFEQSEYTAVVTDALRRTQNHSENAWGVHVAHQVALMTVLVSRAARALSARSFVDKVESYQEEQLVLTERPAAAFIAYDKLSRELRRWTLLLERCYSWIGCDRTTAERHGQRQVADTFADPDAIWATACAEANNPGGARFRATAAPYTRLRSVAPPQPDHSEHETYSVEPEPRNTGGPPMHAVPESPLRARVTDTTDSPAPTPLAPGQPDRATSEPSRSAETTPAAWAFPGFSPPPREMETSSPP